MAKAQNGNVVVLRRRCPACLGKTFSLTALGSLEPCHICDSLGIVTPKQAADYERQQRAQAEASVLP